MKMKLFDSELKVMGILWEKGEMKAKDIARIFRDEIGWNKNTTYTVIKKCVEKGAIERIEPDFLCKPLVDKREVQKQETEELIEKLYGGSKMELLVTLLDGKNLTNTKIPVQNWNCKTHQSYAENQ